MLREVIGETPVEQVKSVLILAFAALAAIGLQQLAATRQQVAARPAAEAQALEVARSFGATKNESGRLARRESTPS